MISQTLKICLAKPFADRKILSFGKHSCQREWFNSGSLSCFQYIFTNIYRHQNLTFFSHIFLTLINSQCISYGSDDAHRYWISWYWKKILKTGFHIFLSLEKYFIWNQPFGIRWKKSLIINIFFKIRLTWRLVFGSPFNFH